MVAAAWVISIVLSLPQAIVFREGRETEINLGALTISQQRRHCESIALVITWVVAAQNSLKARPRSHTHYISAGLLVCFPLNLPLSLSPSSSRKSRSPEGTTHTCSASFVEDWGVEVRARNLNSIPHKIMAKYKLCSC